MAVLQADLLKDLDDRGEEESDVVAELHWATNLSPDLSQTYRFRLPRKWPEPSAVYILSTERHPWLNQGSRFRLSMSFVYYELQDKDRFFLLDALLSPSGLFGDTVDTVVKRFQQAKKQAAAFQHFLPCRSQVFGIAEREHSTSQTHIQFAHTITYALMLLALFW